MGLGISKTCGLSLTSFWHRQPGCGLPCVKLYSLWSNE